MTRALWWLAAATVGIALLATLAFVVVTLPVRIPYWGEAEVLYEAARLRAHQPLFVDPLVGTNDVPPSRYYVTYPPLLAWALSFVSGTNAMMLGRIACTLAWYGTLGGIAWRSRRLEVAGAAAFVGSVWVLANFAMLARPDSIAAAVGALALWRATDPKRARLDPLTIALFVLVPWIKPTMIGLPIGALLASRDRRALGIAAGLALVSALVAGKTLFVHVVLSNAQPFSASAWLEQVPSRLAFFAPLLGWALWLGRRERIALGAAIGAVAWTLIALAKTGSSSNYWMEPCVAALVLLARAPRADYTNVRLAAAAVATALYSGVASVNGALSHARELRHDAETVAQLGEQCFEAPGDVVAADEAGIELVLDDRVLMPTYQMAYLVVAKRLPASLFTEEIAAARCYVEHTGQLALVPEAHALLEARFERVRSVGSFVLWKRAR